MLDWYELHVLPPTPRPDTQPFLTVPNITCSHHIQIKQEKFETEESLEDAQESAQHLLLFQDGLMNHIDALKTQVRNLGAIPVDKPAKRLD